MVIWVTLPLSSRQTIIDAPGITGAVCSAVGDEDASFGCGQGQSPLWVNGIVKLYIKNVGQTYVSAPKYAYLKCVFAKLYPNLQQNDHRLHDGYQHAQDHDQR